MDNRRFLRIFIPKAGFYLWIIFIIVLLNTAKDLAQKSDMTWSIVSFVLFFVLVIYNFWNSHNRKNEIVKYIEDLSFDIDSATKDTLLSFSLPLVVLESDGKIIWYNSLFKKINEDSTIIEMLAKEFNNKYLFNQENNIDTNISWNTLIGSRYYEVLGNKIITEEKPGSEKSLIVLYFFDTTELYELKKRNEDEKTGIAIIMIDNYDDLMQSIDDTKRPQMLAEIEKKVSGWIENTGGILKKFERDKYLFIFENQYLKEFEEHKFDILESIKEINIGNKIPVTLSIGISISSEILIENFRNASAAVDLALSRGGDHTVIREHENYRFYGGKTRELEKRTKVKARVIAYALKDLIDNSPAVIIMGHEHCDIDCLGSSLGIYRIACSRGKEARIVLNDYPDTIEKLVTKIKKDPEYENLFIDKNRAFDVITPKTLLIVLDTHRPSFTECPELLKMTDQIVVIDHHRRSAEAIQNAVITYQETYASSTCELVTEILQYVDDKIVLRAVEAEALYSGIVVDTKNFMFKTGVRTFEAASFLRKHGVDTIGVRNFFQSDLETYLNISSVIKNSEFVYEGVVIAVCPSNIKNTHLVTAQAADQLQTLTGVNAAFVLTQLNGEVIISGRSLGEINVQMIMEKLGGGGHMAVAGAQLSGVSVSEAKEMLKKAIKDTLTQKD